MPNSYRNQKYFYSRTAYFFINYLSSYKTIKAMTWQIFLIHQTLVVMETAHNGPKSPKLQSIFPDDNETLLDFYIWYEVFLGHYLQIVSPCFENFKFWFQNNPQIPIFGPKYVVQLLNASKTLLDFYVRHKVSSGHYQQVSIFRPNMLFNC